MSDEEDPPLLDLRLVVRNGDGPMLEGIALVGSSAIAQVQGTDLGDVTRVLSRSAIDALGFKPRPPVPLPKRRVW